MQEDEQLSQRSLADLKEVGSRVRIVDVVGEDAVSIRLMEMGLTEDEEIQLISFAPLGDPIEFSVRGYRITLRSTEAQRVLITEC